MDTHAPYAQWSQDTFLVLDTVADLVVIAPGFMAFALGDPGVYAVATAYGADGLPLAASFTWTSSDTSVATVSPTGYVVPIGQGATTIRATALLGAFGEIAAGVGVSGAAFEEPADPDLFAITDAGTLTLSESDETETLFLGSAPVGILASANPDYYDLDPDGEILVLPVGDSTDYLEEVEEDGYLVSTTDDPDVYQIVGPAVQMAFRETDDTLLVY